jgi:hypothetical protein
MYMFRASWVHHQEDSLYMQFCMVCVSYIYVSSLAGGRVCSLNYSINLKSVYFVGLRYVIASQCTVQKNIQCQKLVTHLWHIHYVICFLPERNAVNSTGSRQLSYMVPRAEHIDNIHNSSNNMRKKKTHFIAAIILFEQTREQSDFWNAYHSQPKAYHV